MSDTVMKYLASKVVDDIRTKHIPDDLAKELYSKVYIDSLRAELKPSDLERLKELAANGTVFEGRLAINLLNRSCWQDAHNKPQKQIIDLLLEVWNKATEYLRKHAAMMVLLEDDALATNEEQRDDFYRDLESNMDEFKKIMITYAPGGESGVLDFCKERLLDPGYPVSKDWTYLCGAMASNDKSGIRELLSNFTSAEPFNERVAKDMLARLQ